MSIILFISILSILVFVHELGHFWVAKKAGIKVEEFGFGFPPRIFAKKYGETVYSLNLIPLGGFVKIFGEKGEGKDLDYSFSSKTVWEKIKVIVAGPLMNWLLAFVLFSILTVVGLPSVIENDSKYPVRNEAVTIINTVNNSPAAFADLKPGDNLISLKFNLENKTIISEINDIEEFKNIVDQNKDKQIYLTIKRGREILEKSLIPRSNYPDGQGPLGVTLTKTGLISYPFYLAPFKGLEITTNLTIEFIKGFFNMLKNLIFSGKLSADIAGPIGIATLTNQFSQLGLIYLLQFVAILSLNLAIMNMLPIPALDGGRFLFLIIETVKRTPINQKTENLIHAIGFALLITLMIVVTIKDINKLF